MYHIKHVLYIWVVLLPYVYQINTPRTSMLRCIHSVCRGVAIGQHIQYVVQ